MSIWFATLCLRRNIVYSTTIRTLDSANSFHKQEKELSWHTHTHTHIQTHTHRLQCRTPSNHPSLLSAATKVSGYSPFVSLLRCLYQISKCTTQHSTEMMIQYYHITSYQSYHIISAPPLPLPLHAPECTSVCAPTYLVGPIITSHHRSHRHHQEALPIWFTK